jgi:hypothetical protein
MNLDELTQKVANHLAGRPVKIRWQETPGEGGIGQTVKTPDGKFILYVADYGGVKTKLRTLLHECSHARNDHDWIPVSSEHQAPGSSKRTPGDWARWQANPREERAQRFEKMWFKYAEKNAYKFMNITGADYYMKRLLSALLDWR